MTWSQWNKELVGTGWIRRSTDLRPPPLPRAPLGRNGIIAGAVAFCLVAGALVGLWLLVSNHDAKVLARTLCEDALGSQVLNSASGTVNDVRTLVVGPLWPAHPFSYPHAFPKASGSQAIGWCWTGHPSNYTLYAATSGYPPLRVEGLAGPLETRTPAPGPAPIP